MNSYLRLFALYFLFTPLASLADEMPQDLSLQSNSSESLSSETITPATVFQYALQLKKSLHHISLEMGINPGERTVIGVSNVSPREVYFQAATLYKKSSQLMFEFTGKEDINILQVNVNARPSDVLSLLKSVNTHLHEVKIGIGMELFDYEVGFDENMTPTDVFQTIFELNRTINHLLEFRFSPAHVHQKITEAIAIASAILETYPEATAVFYPGPKERRKQPRDVYHKMTMMYDHMLPIMVHFGKTCLLLADSEKNRVDIVPADVYDLAVMIVSQLHYMNSFVPDTPVPKTSYYPGKVLPSDVFQRLTILEQQMMELKRVIHINNLLDNR